MVDFVATAAEAVAGIGNGATVMVGGFGAAGACAAPGGTPPGGTAAGRGFGRGGGGGGPLRMTVVTASRTPSRRLA